MKKIALLILCLVSLLRMAVAQTQSETYRLQVEDVLRIQVFGIQEIAAEVRIGKDGNVTPPFIDSIRAEGLTVGELRADLVREYVRQLRLRDPRISVMIVQYRQMTASATGAFNRGGQVPVRQGDTLLDLIAAGGGLFPNNAADGKRATLQRRGSKELIPVDLDALLKRGDLSQNYELQDGDVLNVPENLNNRIFIFGAVQQPGAKLYRDGMTVSEALIDAGGDIPYRTQLSKTTVQRPRPGAPGQYDFMEVDLIKFLKKNDANQNLALRPGDIVFFADSKTPDANRIAQLSTSVANFFYILDRFGIKVIR